MTQPIRWLVALEGDQMDLEEFPLWFPKGDFHAIFEGSTVFLTGAGFSSCSKPEQAKVRAVQVLDEFGATICLLWSGYQAPTIGTIYEILSDGTRHGTQISTYGLAVERSKIRASSALPPGADPGSTQAQMLWAAAKSSVRLETVLLLWADPVRTWPRLYRIVEELESHLIQKLNLAGFCSAKERQRFTQSTGSAEVAGKDSRHARGKFQAPTDPMSIGEATDFVSAMITKVLQARSRTMHSGPAI